MSRDTMYRFYSKDTGKLKRITTPGYIGIESMQCFYKKYKNLNKEVEFGENGYSASTAYLTSVHSMKVLPSPLGLMQHKGKEHTITAKNLKMGSTYASALSSSMKYLTNTRAVELPGNR